MRKFVQGGDSTVNLANGTIIRAQYRTLPDGIRVYVGTDITEIVAGEQKRRELEAQLYHSQKLEALGTLAGGIAHDLNNTLVPIMALTKLAQVQTEKGSKVHARLDTVLRASERARDLVKQILFFSRKQDLLTQEVDLGAVIRETLQMLRASLPATVVIVERVSDVPTVLGDSGQLQQVVVNMMTNAAQAIGGKIAWVPTKSHAREWPANSNSS